jgi:hypothetical protein
MPSKVHSKLDALHNSLDPADETKEPLRDMLLSAREACNGAPDKLQAISETIGHVALILARSEMHKADYIDAAATKAVQAHTSSCPLRGTVSGKAAVLYPFRWPIAVVLCVGMIVLGGDRLWTLIERHSDKAQVTHYQPQG